MSADLHLLKRGGVYYWRRRIPRSFAPGLGSSHILLSLRVREPASARRLGRRLSVIFDEAMQTIELEQRVPSPQELQSIYQRLYALIIDRCELQAANRYIVEDIPDEAFENADPIPEPASADYDAYLRASEEAHMFDDPQESSADFRRFLIENRFIPVRQLLEPILADLGIDAANDSMEFRRFLRDATTLAAGAFEEAAQKASGAGIDAKIAMLLEVARHQPRAMVPAGNGRSIVSTPTYSIAPVTAYDDDPDCLLHAPLSECCAGYVKSKAGKKWADKQARDANPVFRLLIDFFGDVPAANIRRTDAMRYRDALARVPTQTRIKPFKGLTLQEMTALADEIDEGLASGDKRYADYAKRKWVTAGRIDRFSLKNQDKYILYAHGLFEYILDTAPLDVRMRNPFDRLLHGEETIKQRRGEVRTAWTTIDIGRLLTSPVWTGCLSEWYRAEPGDLIIKDHRYWIPLICLFAGLRLAEACQLKARDFETVNDMPFLFVRRGRGQKIKNASSRRAVPIHKQLVNAGLLDYVQSRAGDGDGWLFPVPRATKRRKRSVERIPADEFSKWFGRYRAADSVGIADDEHDFHSLRHTFITRLKQGVLRDIVQAIVGHKGVKTATDDYFHGYEPAVLDAALQSLDYGVTL